MADPLHDGRARGGLEQVMYKSGDLEIYTRCPTLVDGFCECDDAYHSRLHDARSDGLPEYGEVYLPHSCDEWVIGGPEQVRALIADLETVLGGRK